MSDRFKFRGKRVDNGERIIGYIFYDEQIDTYYICRLSGRGNIVDIEVDPASLFQCTGLRDKKGLLVRLPCKIGDKFYSIEDARVCEWKVYSVAYEGHCVELGCETWHGSTAAFRNRKEVKYFSCGDERLYNTREEAEAVLQTEVITDEYAKADVN